MRRLAIPPAVFVPIGALIGAALAAAPALSRPVQAPAAPAPAAAAPGSASVLGGGGPIDVTSAGFERVGPLHLIYKGEVEAIQGQARLRSPQIDIFYAQKGAAPGDHSATASVGAIERMEAEGPVYYVTPTQTAKGDHGTYIAADDSIIMTGNVVLTNDKNVATGSRLVIHQKTSQAVLSETPGKRIRTVLYPNQPAPAAAPGAGPAPAKAPAPPKAPVSAKASAKAPAPPARR